MDTGDLATSRVLSIITAAGAILAIFGAGVAAGLALAKAEMAQYGAGPSSRDAVESFGLIADDLERLRD